MFPVLGDYKYVDSKQAKLGMGLAGWSVRALDALHFR